jgi:hypothetical protein
MEQTLSFAEKEARVRTLMSSGRRYEQMTHEERTLIGQFFELHDLNIVREVGGDLEKTLVLTPGYGN